MQLWLQGGKGEEGKEYDMYEPFFKSSNAWRVARGGENLLALNLTHYCLLFIAKCIKQINYY